MPQVPLLLNNRYDFKGQLGRGGMGVVYRVGDRQQGDRQVALKAIAGVDPNDAGAQLRFREEFRVMTRLQHPNLLAVHDFGVLEDGAPYFTMELVEGEDLEHLIAREQTSPARAYDLLIQLLQALDFIHSRRYVHRDIKSQNIRVTPAGRLVLMDFGLMAQLGLPSAGGSISGTPGYLPPEVVRGGVIDASSDLYSVGCLAFELLTGRLPFTGDLRAVIRDHVQTPPPTLRALRPDVPEALERIVMRLLEKDQSRRYREAADVIADLASLAGIAVARPSDEQKRSYLASAHLIGREEELARLDAALATVRAGKGTAALVGAPAGVGKSRLVRDALLQAALDGLTVLQGRCLEHGMAPYEPLAEALRPLLAHSTPEELAARPRLAHLFPELGSPPPAEDADEEKQRIDHEVATWLAEQAARRPLAIFLEDLQWSDDRSVEVFCHAICVLAERPVLLLGNFRNDELAARSPLWYPIEDGQAAYITLAPFGRDQVAAMLGAMLGPLPDGEALAEALYEVTAGNAFFVAEVARFMLDEGLLTRRGGSWVAVEDPRRLALPGTVADTVGRRLALASPDALALARVAAVIGREQGLEMLQAVGRLDETRMFEALDELVERQFVLRQDGRYALVHDRVREVLYREIPEEERRSLHQACGEYLERAHAGRHDAVIDELAHHFALGQDARKAWRYLARAGDVAERAGMEGVAVARWSQAARLLETLDEPDRAAHLLALWLEVGMNGFALKPGDAIRALERVAAVLEPADARLPGVMMYLSVAYGFQGRPAEGLSAVSRGLALVGAERGLSHVALETMRCPSLVAMGRVDECIANARAAAALLDAADGGTLPAHAARARVGAYGHQNACAYQGYRPDERVLAASVRTAEALGDRTHFTSRHYFGVWCAWTGRHTEAQAYLDEARQTCRLINAPPTAWMLYVAPYMLYLRGEHGEARQLIARAWRHEALADAALPRALMRVLEGQTALCAGDLEVAERLLAEVALEAAESSLGLALARAQLGQAEVAIYRKDWALARALLTTVLEPARVGPLRNPLHAALALQRLGRVAVTAGKPAEALSHLDAAVVTFGASATQNPYELARTQLVVGEAQAALGNKAAAASAYRAAGDGFTALENRHWLHQVVVAMEALASAPVAPSREAGLESRWQVARAFGPM